MIKCIVEMVDGKPKGKIIKGKGQVEELEGLELIRYLSNIDEKLYGRKVRKQPFVKEERINDTLIYINRKNNIRIRDYRVTTRALFDIYKENRKTIRNEVTTKSVKKGIAVIATITALGIGGGAISHMMNTSGKDMDIETNTLDYTNDLVKTDDDNLSQDNDIEIRTIDTTVTGTITPVSKSFDEKEEMTNDEIQSIINITPVKLDVDSVYDQGIDDNIEKIYDIILEKSDKWGISPSLIKDIISQESSGGSVDQVGQLEFDKWEEELMTIHDFELGRGIKVVFTRNPSIWQGKADMVITPKDLKSVKTQVDALCITYRRYLGIYNYNIVAALEAYNAGAGSAQSMLDNAAYHMGVSVEDILNNSNDISWLQYAWKDQNNLNYVQEIAKHISLGQEDGLNDVYTIKKIENGEIIKESIQFKTNGISK